MRDTLDAFLNDQITRWTTEHHPESPIRRLIPALAERFSDFGNRLQLAAAITFAAEHYDDPLGRAANLGRVCGLGLDRQSAREVIEAARRELTGEHDQPLALFDPWTLASQALPLWRVKGILPAVGLAVVIGPPSVGKSFGAFDQAGAAAQGRPWFGHKPQGPTPFVWLALEGAGGMAARLAAYGRQHTPLGFDDCRILLGSFDLCEARDRRRLVEAIKASELTSPTIYIDTLARAMPGRDENSSADMGLAIAGASELIEALDTAVVLIHHTGKDTTRGARGHSSLPAAADVVLEFRRNGPDRSWRLLKSKDGQDGAEFAFALRTHVLEHDAEGDPVTSCSIEPIDAPPPSASLPSLAGTNTGAALLHLLEELDASGWKPEPGEIPADLGRADRVASYEAWAERFKLRYDPGATAAAKRNALSKARRSLRAEHHAINGYGDLVWVTPAEASAEARTFITRHWAGQAREAGSHE